MNKVMICVPVSEKKDEEILDLIKEININTHVDVIEWRCDYYEGVEDINKVISLLQRIQKMNRKKLLFTYRTSFEGGNGKMDVKRYFKLIDSVISLRLVDMIDIEFMREYPSIQCIMASAKAGNIKVILSNHDFDSTPKKEVLCERFNSMLSKGADIAKIAVMPRCEEDVVVVEEACKVASAKGNVIAISMGELGQRTRIFAKEMGSVMTFASWNKGSAPGQIDVNTLYELMHQK